MIVAESEAVKHCVSISTVMGNMARWVAEQSPFNTTRGVDQVNQVLYEAAGEWETVCEGDRFRAHMFSSQRELEEWVRGALGDHPQLERWNTAYKGHFSDPNAEGFQTSSRFDGPAPAYDFIDLDALFRNVSREIWRECERSAAFDAAFEAKQALVQENGEAS